MESAGLAHVSHSEQARPFSVAEGGLSFFLFGILSLLHGLCSGFSCLWCSVIFIVKTAIAFPFLMVVEY